MAEPKQIEEQELKRLLASAELRNPGKFNASRERYLVEISFKAGERAAFEKVIKEISRVSELSQDGWWLNIHLDAWEALKSELLGKSPMYLDGKGQWQTKGGLNANSK